MSPPAPATGGDLDTEDGHAGPTLTYYVLLGVAHDVSVKDDTPSASSTQETDHAVRKAYLRKAAQCHPDKNPDDPLAKEAFQAVAEAYGCLSKASEREAYDRKLAAANLPPTPHHPHLGHGHRHHHQHRPHHSSYHAFHPFGSLPNQASGQTYRDRFRRPARSAPHPEGHMHSPFNSDPWGDTWHDPFIARPGFPHLPPDPTPFSCEEPRYRHADPYASAGFRPTGSYTAREDGHGGDHDGARRGGNAGAGGRGRERARYAGMGYAELERDARGREASRETTPGSRPDWAGYMAGDMGVAEDRDGNEDEDGETADEPDSPESFHYTPIRSALPQTSKIPEVRSFTVPFALHNLLRATFLAPPLTARHTQHHAHARAHAHPHRRPGLPKPFGPLISFPIPPFAEIERMLRDLGVSPLEQAQARDVRAKARMTMRMEMQARAQAGAGVLGSGAMPTPMSMPMAMPVPMPMLPSFRSSVHGASWQSGARPVPMSDMPNGQHSPHAHVRFTPPHLGQRPNFAPPPSVNMPHAPRVPPSLPHLTPRRSAHTAIPVSPLGPPARPPVGSGIRCPPPSAASSHFESDVSITDNGVRSVFDEGRDNISSTGPGWPDVRQPSWRFTSSDGSLRGMAHVAHATWSM